MSAPDFFFGLLLLAALILTNAFFAASEIAIVTLNDAKIRKMAAQGHAGAKILAGMLSEPTRFLATIQVGVTLSGFLASAVAAESFSLALSHWLVTTLPGLELTEETVHPAMVFAITVILSYFSLVFGELVPKRIAMRYPEPISMAVARPLQLLSRVSATFIRLLSFSTNKIVALFGVPQQAEEEKVTEEEIRLMMETGQERGVILASEKKMIENIFDFDTLTVEEMMLHRSRIVALSADATYAQAIELVLGENYTRIPVYQGNIDNILGILHVKDLLRAAAGGGAQFDLRKTLRPVLFVPFSQKTDKVFQQMQREKIHIAIVVDEYGCTAGLVSLEDLLEEIVGKIQDEHDVEDKDLEALDKQSWTAKGKAELAAVEAALGVRFYDEEHQTLNGLLVSRLGRIPAEDETPTLRIGNLVFRIEETRQRRIQKVHISRV